MCYKNLPYGYKKERILDMIDYLEKGYELDTNTMFIEEIKFLKQLFGDKLSHKKNMLKITQAET